MDGHRAPLSGARLAGARRYGVPLAFLALFFVYPLAAIVERGLRGEGDRAARRPHRPGRRATSCGSRSGRRSRRRCSRSPSRCPAAYVLGRYRFRGRSLVSALVVVPFVLPTVVVALAFLAILPDGARAGMGADPRRARVLQRRRRRAHRRDVLGEPRPAGRRGGGDARRGAVARLREITLPLLAPALAAAAAIVFLFSFTSFGVVLILGGPRYATLETEIYNQAVRLFDLRAAAVLSLVQLACVVGGRLGRDALERRLVVDRAARAPSADVLRPPANGARQARRRREPRRRSALFLGAAARRARRALARRRRRARPRRLPSARRARRASSSLRRGRPSLNSVVFAAAATVDRGRRRRPRGVRARATSRGSRCSTGCVLLPLGVSAVMLGLRVPDRLRHRAARLPRRAVARPVAQALVAIPFVVRIVAPRCASIDPRLREAAACSARRPGVSGARSTCRSSPAALAVAAGVRVRDLARRVRRDRLPRPARPADAAGRDLPLPRPAGRAQRRAGVRARGRAHGA